MGDWSGRAGLVERRGDGGALRREACPAGAERAGPKRNGESVPASRSAQGRYRPLGKGSEGRTGSPGEERQGGTRLPSDISAAGPQAAELPSALDA